MLLLYRGFNHRFVPLAIANTLAAARRIGIPAARDFDRFC